MLRRRVACFRLLSLDAFLSSSAPSFWFRLCQSLSLSLSLSCFISWEFENNTSHFNDVWHEQGYFRVYLFWKWQNSFSSHFNDVWQEQGWAIVHDMRYLLEPHKGASWNRSVSCFFLPSTFSLDSLLSRTYMSGCFAMPFALTQSGIVAGTIRWRSPFRRSAYNTP